MRNSIGSLAALTATFAAAPAALHAVEPLSDVRAASFENVSLSLAIPNTTVELDIDGDGESDFGFRYTNSGMLAVVSYYDHTLSAITLSEGVEFFANSASESSYNLDLTFDGWSGYFGISFVADRDLIDPLNNEFYAGWFYLERTATDLIAVRGGWEAESYYQSITVGDPALSPVPEPSAAGLLAGAATLAGALGLRRRRRS